MHAMCLIPFPNQPCTLSASLAVRLYCRRFAFAFAFTNDLERNYQSLIKVWLQEKLRSH